MARLIRVITSFAAVLTAYCVYAMVAVPLIEPAARAPRAGPARSDHSRAASRVDDGLAALVELFPPEARQKLEHPKILESDQFKLLLRDYKNLGDGRVRIEPCMLIYRPSGSGDGATASPPIVLYAPDGALMRFDRPLDLRRASVGQPVAGRLLGEISIHSPGREPGPDDDLEIRTRDVQLTGDRISTQNPVRFRYGASFGSGRNLEIMLLHDEDRPSAGKNNLKIKGVELFELRQLDRLHLEFPEDTPQVAARGGGPAGPSDWDSRRPLEITCRGPFRFDPVRQFATFAEQVDVLQLNPNGPVDQLNCEQLTIHFSRSRQGLMELAVPDRGPQIGTPGKSSLHLREIEAIGNPVIVRAPSRDAEARGERLAYDVQQEQVVLEGTEEVFLRQGKNEIHARSVRYKSKGKGRLGEIFSQGPGWMRGELADRPGQEVRIHWGGQLQLRPYEEQHVASLSGAVELNYAGIGNLKAGEIHCWLFEIPAGPGQEKLELKPDRMLVQGLDAGGATPTAPNRQLPPPRLLPPATSAADQSPQYAVEIDSPQVFGSVNRMEIWFEEPDRPAGSAAGPGTAAAPAEGHAPDNTPLASRLQPEPEKPLQRRFRVRGQLVQSRVLIRERQGELSELMLEGDVQLDEIPLVQASEQPIRVTGDRVQAIDAESPNTNISVIGRPAQFRGRGLTLTGTNINVNAGTNRLWIDGSGQMELPLDRDLDGKPLAQPAALLINWQQRMDFDGQTALFEEAVTANTSSQMLRTETLEVRFAHPIQFRQPGSQPQPDVDRLTCRGGVLLEGRSFDGPAQLSWEQFEAGGLWINRTTGEIFAQGPGRVTSIRPRAANLGLLPEAAAAAAAPPPGRRDQLACLDVRFQRSLSGNIDNRKIVFQDQVQCAYGDVGSWQSRLDIHDPDSLGDTGVKLCADQLTVAEAIAQVNGRQSVELEAIGNVIAENRSYTGRALRMTYSEGKDLLILEGDGHAAAELAYQKFIGGPVLTSAARQIYFWPSTKSVKAADGQSLEMNLQGP